MKKLLAIVALLGVVAVGSSQNISKAGLYDKQGNLVVGEVEECTLGVTLRVTVEHFTPGVYARYAQKYLGKRATLSEYSSIELIEGRLTVGALQKPSVQVVKPEQELPLPINRISSTAQTTEEQAASTANMIFSLRKHRLDLITGEAGENVFGAGLKSALDEIARMEQECLEMFYGKMVTSEEVHTFNVAIVADKSDYMVCRFSEKSGIVAVDDLSGAPVVLHIATEKHKGYAELQPLGPKDKVAAEYRIVPQSKATLLFDAKLLDEAQFASAIFEKRVTALPIK